MDIFIGGVLIGLILGVWLSVAFFYFSLSRQKSDAPITQVTGSFASSGQETPSIDWWPRRKPQPVEEPPCRLRLDSVETRDLFHQLVLMTHGDRAQAERPVCHEKYKRPDAPESMLIDNAIYRLLRDNR